MTRSLFAYAVNTKANILAGSYHEGALGYATDTNEFGHYDGAAWVWGVNGGDHTALTNIGTNTHAQIDTALTRLANTSGTNTGDTTVSDTASVDLTITGQLLSANVLPGGVDHNSLLNYAANRHFLQTDIDHLSTGLSTGLTKVTNGTGALSVIPDNSSNWNTAFGWGNHASAGYVAGNGAITGATKTKITYDTKGLVTAGADATTADIADSLDKRYVTDAQLAQIHAALTVSDTASIDLTLTGQALSAAVLPGGVDHNNLANLTVGNPHTQYLLNSLLTTRGDIIRRGASAPERYGLSVPASGTLNYLGVNNGETDPSWKSASSNPGAAASLLQSNASGYLRLIRLGIATDPTAALHLGGTGGTAAEGALFGTDTNLYRSAANTLKTDDDLYVTGTATLIANPSNDNHGIARRYAQSKGMNLFVNGFVGMLSNYNLSGLTFDASDQYAGNGMLTKTSLGNLLSDEFIPVDPNRYYKASMWVKTLVDAGSSFNKFYSGFAAYDADSLFINAFMVVKQGASVQTTLAAPLKAGDTTISLTASTNWYNGATAAARNLVLYPYYNAGGYKYDDYTYSRHTTQGSAAYGSGGAWANGGISGTTITLVSAWPSGELFPQTHKTHATTEPTWPTGAGAYVYDNNIYWQEAGAPVGGETAWSAGATITVNSYRVPTVANGHRYQAVDVNVWPAGTAVQNTNNPGTYRYPFANNVTPGTAWTNYTGVIGGYDTTGAGTATLFPYGTAFIKLAFLFNYTGTSSNKQGISAIWFSEVTANNIEAASATQQGVVSLGDQVLGTGVKSIASLVVNDGASGTADTRMESATEQYMFLLDANGNTNGTLHFGGVTNGIQIDKGGRLTFNGTATYWKDVAPYSVSTGSGPSAPALAQYGTTGHYLRKFSDNHGSDEALTIAFQMPHEWKLGSDVHFHIHVIPSANGSGGNNQVIFRASYQWVNIDGSFSTTTNVDLDTTFTVGASDGNAHKLWEPSAISGSGKTLSGGLLITLSRLSKTNPGGADNYTGDVWLLFSDCHCECDAVGSADETVK